MFAGRKTFQINIVCLRVKACNLQIYHFQLRVITLEPYNKFKPVKNMKNFETFNQGKPNLHRQKDKQG